ncbi:NADPH-dependent FMN reductase [Paenibacillus beijingensis]|uniref:NADPH-dependent FMN reductase-like domain-containing protein n=1 Tax=Paenibacillus beijingensis TaxID=1126833 RepID=A0A0D5NPU0_9BACL|nr:NADPH-dependent FMN reductase [Paenibacillus beijingensis]AJY77027.1 hypothetical protein VN24_23845 [Paenibacillus beijingensis]
MNIVIIAGSNRKGATSTRLAEYVEGLIKEQHANVKLFDLYRSPVPFYSTDQPYSDHAALKELKQAVLNADGIILATPEYHGSISGVLKNALDHLSQEHFGNKPVLSMSSSGGAVGVSSLQQLQAIVRNLHGINMPEWISIGGEQRNWFEPGGSGVGHDMEVRIRRALGAFLEFTQRLAVKV